MKKTFTFLVAITVLAFALRFYDLGRTPALNADEAALGYNAYSLIRTGLDEHGNKWPLHFQSFNDFKPGLTVYVILPAVAAFGLNEWSVRVIPALIGVLTVPLFYLLLKKLGEKEKNSELLALIGAFFIAISPWHIHFSRGAWEVNIATFLLLSGFYCFLKSTQQKKYLFLSVLSFALSLYTYHSARVVAPLLATGLAAVYFHELKKHTKTTILAVLFGLVLCVPLVFSLRGPAGLARAGGVGLWADMGPVNRANELRGDYQNSDGIAAKIFHNKPVAYSLAFLNNWTEHFWGEFLFLSGDDIQRSKVPETGQFNLLDVLFLGIGLVAVSRRLNKNWGLVMWWSVIAPIPAALTFQSPHALRAENMVVPLTILISLGAYAVATVQLERRLRLILHFSSLAIVLVLFARYVHMYYVHMAKEYPYSSQYGVKELTDYIIPISDRYEHVVITDRYDQPYIMVLFYGVMSGDTRFEPAAFQNKHVLTAPDQYGFSTVREFGVFKFESVKFEEARNIYPKSLIIGTEKEIPVEANIQKDVYGSNGFRYFRVVAN